MPTVAPELGPATATGATGPVPFGGRGAAGGAWKLALLLLAVAGVLVLWYAALVLLVTRYPAGGDQDARSWQALGAIAMAVVVAALAFATWAAAVVLAALGKGVLARTVLGLFVPVAVLLAAFAAVALPDAGTKWVPGLPLAAAVAGLAALPAAWRRAP